MFKWLTSFFDDDTTYYAASLSFYTIFATIPILLILFYIFTTMPVFDNLFEQFKNNLFTLLLPGKSEVVVEYLESFLQNTEKLGYIGVAYIAIVSLIFVHDYEYIVSNIFEEKKRRLHISLSLYFIFLIIVPIVLVLYIYLYQVTKDFMGINILSYLVIWILFMILHIFSAPRKLYFQAVWFSALVSSALLSLAKIAFLEYITLNQTYSTIYGSFSALLFSFVWVYISWIIYLYGLKLCHKIDKSRSYQHHISQ